MSSEREFDDLFKILKTSETSRAKGLGTPGREMTINDIARSAKSNRKLRREILHDLSKLMEEGDYPATRLKKMMPKLRRRSS